MLQFWNILYLGGRRLLITESLSWERHDIRSHRVKFLRTVKAYREKWRPILYTQGNKQLYEGKFEGNYILMAFFHLLLCL